MIWSPEGLWKSQLFKDKKSSDDNGSVRTHISGSARKPQALS